MAEYVRDTVKSASQRAVRYGMLPAGLGLAAAAAVLALTTHYPTGPEVMSVLFVFGCAAFFAWPKAGLLLLPALLPLIGLAPWTGWITFEELDILVLAVAAGGYARMA